MKLNWFSPLSPAATDIAHYTWRVLPALASVADVTLWTTKRRWSKELEAFATVRRYGLDQLPWTELNRADMTFYNIGNNPRFHWSIWQVSLLQPGVVVLHDFRLHHFFDWIYRCRHQDLNLYLKTIEQFYGSAALDDARHCFNSNAENIDLMAERYPLTELAIGDALGVMVHTQEALLNLQAKQLAPIVYASLPYAVREAIVPRPSQPPFKLIVFGYLGRNRRLESVIKALADLPEREKFRLDIFGTLLDGADNLRRLIREHKLSSLIRLRGFVPEEQLDDALSQAHLAINLRSPTVGEASGSQLRIWSHALPSLVTPEGWYSGLPSDAVTFVRSGEKEVSDLQAQLRKFLESPEEFARMGRRGHERLKTDHSPQTYAAKVVELATLATENRPKRAAETLAKRAGASLNEWIDPSHFELPLRHVIDEAMSLVKG
jgi:glycosyltransferase involved in cell wall biosynthesis